MLQVGLIGFGRIGAEHAGWIEASSRCRVGGVFDPTPARISLANQRGLRTFSSLEAMLAADVDAVLVATPSAFHLAPAVGALRAGKHVMVEKPMAASLDEAKQMHAAAIDAGRVLSVFQNRRWDADVLTLAEHLPRVGKVFNIESRLAQYASCVGPAAKEFRPNWRNEAAFGGGGLNDWGSHFIDQLWRLMLPARVTRVYAQLRGNVWSHDCDDLARVILDFDSGAVGLMEINTTTAAPAPRWRVDGESGTLTSPHSPSYSTREWATFSLHPSRGGEPEALPILSSVLRESDIWDGFALACTTDIEPPVTVESVLVTMELLDAARESSRTGTAIEI